MVGIKQFSETGEDGVAEQAAEDHETAELEAG
jgi:hypothetical protein